MHVDCCVNVLVLTRLDIRCDCDELFTIRELDPIVVCSI